MEIGNFNRPKFPQETCTGRTGLYIYRLFVHSAVYGHTIQVRDFQSRAAFGQHLQLLNILSAAKLENKAIDFETHIAECIALANPVCKNPSLLQDLIYYFSGEKEKSGVVLGTPYRSLNRADAYLFSLCYFDFDNVLKKKLVDAWYALITFYLIIDDLQDIQSDFEQQEENVVIEAGLNDRGAKAVESLIHQSYEVMNGVNPVMANRMDHKRQLMNVKQVIDDFLKKNAK